MRRIDRFKLIKRAHSAYMFGVVLGLPLGACAFSGYAMSSMWGAILISIIPAAAIGLLLLEPRMIDRLQRELRETGGALCPGCGYALTEIRADTCPECGENWTAETARRAWRSALGAAWTKALANERSPAEQARGRERAEQRPE